MDFKGRAVAMDQGGQGNFARVIFGVLALGLLTLLLTRERADFLRQR